MSAGFYITCRCGYELYVPEDKVGAEQECVNCGAALDTRASVVTTDKESSKEEIVAPLEKPVFQDSGHDAFKQSEYSSPFEDDDDPEPSVTDIPITPEADPAPDYAASIFEDEADELQTVDQPKADPSLIRTYQDPEHKAAYQGTTEEESCPRCGNLFRGDWDKQAAGDEIICYICSNQAVDGIPDRLKEQRVIPKNELTHGTGWSGSINTQIPEGPIEDKFWLFNPESSEFRAMLYVLAFGMIILTAGVLIFGGISTPTSVSTVEVEYHPITGEPIEAPELPNWATVLYWVGRVFFALVAQFFSIYAVLMLTDRLPHGKLLGDFIIIGYAMLLLTIMTAIYIALAMTVGETMMGRVLMMMVNVVTLLPCIWILIHVLDFRIRDFFYLFFLSGIVHSLVTLFSKFYYAGIAALAL